MNCKVDKDRVSAYFTFIYPVPIIIACIIKKIIENLLKISVEKFLKKLYRLYYQ